METTDVTITVACDRRLGAMTAAWKEVFHLGQLDFVFFLKSLNKKILTFFSGAIRNVRQKDSGLRNLMQYALF